ncbi:hypothetical protein LCGC14_0141350 [marine sediment metagenome]|uniref:HNH nuclease domain-containing protein n=1 Tax=marine sediment metagenome TaxID=412755 RepID=A0A0F9V4I4_9ZZZZ
MSDSGLSGKEAMRAAAIRGNETRRVRNRNNYAMNLKFCAHCDRQLAYTKRHNRFCNHSCAASANNLGVTRHSKYIKRPCDLCGEITRNPKFCSTRCCCDYIKKLAKPNITINGCFLTSLAAKRYLLRIYGNTCSVCGLSEWNNKPMSICIDHIDGNYQNHSIANVRLICPNCDAQTDTYKGRNRGNGRHARMERYHKGLSY